MSLVAVATAASVLPVNSLAPASFANSNMYSRIRRSPNLSSSYSSSSVSSSSQCNTCYAARGMIILESTMEETLERTSSSPNNNNNINNDGTNNSNLSPLLQGMVDEQRHLQMNVGKAMDTLRKDYPYFLKRSPGKMDLYECVLLSKCRDGDGFVFSHPLTRCSLFPAPLIYLISPPTPTKTLRRLFHLS